MRLLEITREYLKISGTPLYGQYLVTRLSNLAYNSCRQPTLHPTSFSSPDGRVGTHGTMSKCSHNGITNMATKRAWSTVLLCMLRSVMCTWQPKLMEVTRDRICCHDYILPLLECTSLENTRDY